MEINETTFPIEFDWEGELVPPTGRFALAGTEPLLVSIAKPVWLSDSEVFGENWTPPAGGKRYGLARFTFSLRPKEGQTVRRAEFTVALKGYGGGEDPIFLALYPLEVMEEKTRKINVEIAPTLQFLDAAEVSLGQVETTINLGRVTPVISADGLGESTARWVFTAHPAHPLTGSKSVSAIVEVPSGVSAAQATVELNAEIPNSLLESVRLFLRKTEKESKSIYRLF